MRIKSPNGCIEIDVSLISVNFIFGRVFKIKTNEDKTIYCAKRRKSSKRDPEDNLGNVIATLDTYNIDRRCDFDVLNGMIKTILKATGMNEREFFRNADLVSKFCNHFGISLRECISILAEYNPEVFNVAFIKEFIKPIAKSIF